MMKTLNTMALSLGFGLLMTQHLQAQGQNCAPRPAVLEKLTDQFGETRQSIGLAAQGSVMEVFASAETGSWTIIVTLPNGMACLIAAGQSFEALAEVLPARGKDV